MKGRARAVLSVFLGLLVLFSAYVVLLPAAEASHTGIAEKVWGITATFGIASILRYDPVTHVVVSFTPTSLSGSANGRGIAFDGTDLWYTVLSGVGSFTGDGLIHKISTSGGADITTIPDPYGSGGRGIGALDFEAGSLWAISYLPTGGSIPAPGNTETVFEIDPASGAVRASCDVPFGGGGVGTETLVVDTTTGTFLTNAGEAGLTFLDEYLLPTGIGGACTPTGISYVGLATGIGGVDFDSAGNLVVSFTFAGTLHNLGPPAFATILGSDSFGFVEDISVEFVGAVQVPVDVKPQSCRNPLNVNARGRLPVAILGTASFDVTTVDVSTVQLEGVSPITWALEDVATPFVPFTGKEEATDCTDDGPDGLQDLTLKFDRQAIAAALGPLSDGDVVVLHLTGLLLDGTPIVGEDVVVVLKKK